MRVIAGSKRGLKLLSPKDDGAVRPTLDRVKTSIFDSIQFLIEGSNVLDIFAGTGSLGIECISRGAKSVTFNDSSKEAVPLINENLKKCAFSADVYNKDFREFLMFAEKNGLKYDIIFLDPPYDSCFGLKAIDHILSSGILSLGGIIIFEYSDKNFKFSSEGLKVKTKKYGTLYVDYIKRSEL